MEAINPSHEHAGSSSTDLTKAQAAAVEHFEGPLLILAGPGSGKTRVITRRIARLLQRGVSDRELLAITFTNKAAREMAERVQQLVPGNRIEISTFHRFCARLLRRWGRAVGLEANFSICDSADQRQLVRQIVSDLGYDSVHFPPAKIISQISNAKNDLLRAEDFQRKYQESIGNHMQAIVARVYPEYQKTLLEANSVDFDDLLLHVVTLLYENPELREQLDCRYRFILVDEFQDTNMAQYRIVAALSQRYPNLCATGDPDQSIYGWRGAKIDNILQFERDFANSRVIRLEQNFRSTKEILKAADSLISHNIKRKIKALSTDNAAGKPIELLHFADEAQEADLIARRIREAVETEGRSWSDFAILYRVNALSRGLEMAMVRSRVPYQMAGSVAFYERAEIKDLLAYLRLINNPADRVAFLRVVNVPRRGIGKQTLAKLATWADANGMNLLEAANQAGQHPQLSRRAATLLKRFGQLVSEFDFASAGSVAELLQRILERTQYHVPWKQSSDEKDLQRLANVEELITAADQYDRMAGEECTLEGFLESASLASDLDNLDDQSGKVTLMTLHAAKGLEFPIVYIVAVEQNLIPHERSLREGDLHELEEERRLLFVGMTRAEQELYLTETSRRAFRGRPTLTIPSDFLREMTLCHVDLADDSWEVYSRLIEFPRRDDEAQSGASSKRKLRELSDALRNHAKIITAADLLNGTAEPADIPQGFAVGMQVRHPRYGLGTVVSVSGFGRNRNVEVEFAESGERKSFVAAKAPLQPVGRP